MPPAGRTLSCTCQGAGARAAKVIRPMTLPRCEKLVPVRCGPHPGPRSGSCGPVWWIDLWCAGIALEREQDLVPHSPKSSGTGDRSQSDAYKRIRCKIRLRFLSFLDFKAKRPAGNRERRQGRTNQVPTPPYHNPMGVKGHHAPCRCRTESCPPEALCLHAKSSRNQPGTDMGLASALTQACWVNPVARRRVRVSSKSS